MSAPATNPLSYNAYIQQVAAMAVYQTAESGGVYSFVDAPPELIVPQMLNYAELRIQRDLDMLASQSSNIYPLTQGSQVFSLPVDDFVTVQSLEIVTLSGGDQPLTTDSGVLITTDSGTPIYTSGTSVVVDAYPLLPTSKEFIQNCYGGATSAGPPKYFAMYGDNFGDEQDSYTNIYLGPAPNFGYSLRVTGTCRSPSLYNNAEAGIADTGYTYISAYFPDLLVMASMIYLSAFQRNFSATSDSPDMGQTYEKQYQALRLGAIGEENRRKQQGSGWTAYSTPVSATSTR